STSRISCTTASMFGSKNGSLNELSRGLRNVSTSAALPKPLRISSRAIHAEPQISFHEIGPPLSSSRGAIIQRVCTDYLIRAKLSDKMQRVSYASREALVEQRCAWLTMW